MTSKSAGRKGSRRQADKFPAYYSRCGSIRQNSKGGNGGKFFFLQKIFPENRENHAETQFGEREIALPFL
jgi:hypothetical protein